MSPLQNGHWSLRGKAKKNCSSNCCFSGTSHFLNLIQNREGSRVKKNHHPRFALASNYRFASLAAIVLWYSASLLAVAMVPNATGTGTYCQADLGRCTQAQAFCIPS